MAAQVEGIVRLVPKGPPDVCPFCGHSWHSHDPADGMCDSHSNEGIGVCQCGRDLAWMQRKIASRSKAELARLADERMARAPEPR